MTDDETLRMSSAVADQVQDRFNNLSSEFAESRRDVSTLVNGLESACGEFSGSLATGAATFELGFREALDVGRTSAGLIAANTNSFQLELDQVDTDYSWQPSLTEP